MRLKNLAPEETWTYNPIFGIGRDWQLTCRVEVDSTLAFWTVRPTCSYTIEMGNINNR
jgi:hypothetical protein